jgi:hypothetical protein
MVNYDSDAVLAAFVNFRFHSGFTRQDLVNYDAELAAINDGFMTSVLIAVGVPNPSRFDKSKLLMIAAGSQGTFDPAVQEAARTYKRALDIGILSSADVDADTALVSAGAGARAASVRGDTPSTYRGVGPRGYHRTDQRLRETVCERMLLDPYLDASGITVSVSKGRVVLKGTVPSVRMREGAIAAAERVAPGAVRAELRVASATRTPRTKTRSRTRKRKASGGRTKKGRRAQPRRTRGGGR